MRVTDAQSKVVDGVNGALGVSVLVDTNATFSVEEASEIDGGLVPDRFGLFHAVDYIANSSNVRDRKR